MRFSNVLFFATAVLAAPSALHKPEPRQQTVVGTITDTLNILDTTVASNTQSIRDAVQAVRDNTEAAVEVQVRATLRAAFDAIAAALNTATRNIVAVTTGAVGGIGGQAQGLTQEQINQLANSVRVLIRIVQNLQATLTVTATDLRPELQAALAGEINAVKEAISPFLRPLVTFTNAARAFAVTAQLVVTGLNSAFADVTVLIGGFLASIGLPNLSIPAVVGIPGLLGVPGVRTVIANN